MAQPEGFSSSISHHPHHTNIHGVEGCLTASGEVCTACCHTFEVRPIHKEAGEKCQHQSCTGCGIHNQPTQPDICQSYHCNRETRILNDPLLCDSLVRKFALMRIFDLLDSALVLGQISAVEAEQTKAHWQQQLYQVYGL